MDLLSKKCVPCEGGDPALTREEAERLLDQINNYSSSEERSDESRSHSIKESSRQARTINNEWEIVEVSKEGYGSGKALRIRKKFKFEKYMDGINFVDKIAKLAESEGHHPDLEVGYAKVTVNLWTHAVGGLSENDFIMAAKIGKL